MSKKIIKFTSIVLIQLFSVSMFILILPSIIIKERPFETIEKYENNLSLEVNNYSLKINEVKNLNSISLHFKNPGLIGSDQIKIDIKNNNTIIKEFITSGYSIGDSSWIKFEFEPQNITNDTFINISCLSKCQNLYLVGESNNKINYITTTKASSLKESFKNNLNNQFNKFYNNYLFSIFYLSLIIVLNIVLFISL